MPSNAGSWFGRRNAATECEVDLALIAKSDERAQTLDAGQDAVGPPKSALRHRRNGGFRPNADIIYCFVTTTWRKVAGISVLSTLARLYSSNSLVSSVSSCSALPSFEAASNAFIVGP